MSADRAKRAEEIFIEVVDRPKGERTAIIQQRCGSDSRLHAEVRELIALAEDASSGFLDPAEIRQLTLGAGTARLDSPELPAGTRVAGYVIRGVLGSGGMGVVYLADQERPRRTVALKVIRRGLGTAGILRRFEHEAEVLGRLQHPGIAQIYEAGTAEIDGFRQPFIAMEYVRGTSLSKFARDQQLDIPARLALMAQIADAVHHAHQRGVIHRDIKPGNILVDEQGRPKILDFGVARATDAELRVTTLQTSVGQLIGTLAYMSPEQVVGDSRELDTRTDVYALGVVMYELLTGRLPHDLGSRPLPEAARVIREEAPSKLSRISKIFRGEIDTIVSKAIEKDKQRRYQSASELADDIRRYLAGQPILARQNSALYVLGKQLRRHKSWAVTGVIALTALIAFAVYATVAASVQRRLAIEATAARTAAELASSRATDANERLQQELALANIDRGRLEGTLGNGPLAETLLWQEYFAKPTPSNAAYWGLWEFYNRFPCLWTKRAANSPSCAAVSPGAKFVAMGGRSGNMILRFGDDGAAMCRFSGLGGAVNCMVTAPDSSAVYCGMSDGRIIAVPVKDPAAPYALGGGPGHLGAVTSIAVSEDGTIVASGGADRFIRLWDVRANGLISEWIAHSELVISLAFNPGGTRIASSPKLLGDDAFVTEWSVPDGALANCVPTATTGGYITGMQYTPDGTGLLMNDNWRLLTLTKLPAGPVSEFDAVGSAASGGFALSPDRRRYYAVGGDYVYTQGAGRPVRPLARQRYGVMGGAWRDNNTVVVATSDGLVRCLDVRTDISMTRLTGFMSWCFCVEFSPDGSQLTVGSGDGTIRAYSVPGFRPLWTVHVVDSAHRTRGLAYTSDSKTLIAGSMDGAVRFINTETGEVEAMVRASPAEIYSLALNPAGTLIAVGSADAYIRLIDLKSKMPMLTLPRQERRVEGLDFSPDGKTLVSSGLNNSVQVWDASTWQPVYRLETTSYPWGVAFSPDGYTLLVSSYAGNIDVFSTLTRQRRASFAAHPRLVPGIAFSKDGAYFVTGSESGNVKLWDSVTLRPLASFDPSPGEVVEVAFDPKGRFLAAATALRFTAVYDLTKLDPHIQGNRDFWRPAAPK